MANVLINEDTMTDIADAIRSKKGVSTTYKPNEMPSAIESISGGGVTPTGTINITTNGTHDVTNYASANVAVPQGTTPTGTKEISITSNGTTTEDVTNYASAQITVNVQSGGTSSDWEAIYNESITEATSLLDIVWQTAWNDYKAFFIEITNITPSASSNMRLGYNTNKATGTAKGYWLKNGAVSSAYSCLNVLGIIRNGSFFGFNGTIDGILTSSVNNTTIKIFPSTSGVTFTADSVKIYGLK